MAWLASLHDPRPGRRCLPLKAHGSVARKRLEETEQNESEACPGPETRSPRTPPHDCLLSLPAALEQGRGTSRPERCSPDRSSGRNPRPYYGRAALPHRWPQFAERHHHLLEFQTARQRCGKATAGKIGLPTRTPRTHITAWVSPYHPDRRISLAKNTVSNRLTGFSALSPARPAFEATGPGDLFGFLVVLKCSRVVRPEHGAEMRHGELRR